MLRHLERTWCALALAALVCCGCRADRPTGPEDAVEAFFRAVSVRDCESARALLAGGARERFEREPCSEALEALNRKRFEAILSSQVDGRDDDLHLVRARFGDERAPVVIGVRKTRDGHRIVSF